MVEPIPHPIETKVIAATGGSTVGLALAGLIVYVLGLTVYKGKGVPDELSNALVVLLPVVLTFVGGYIAPHTHRPDLAPVAPDPHTEAWLGQLRDPGEPAVPPTGVTTVNESGGVKPTFNNGDEDYRQVPPA
jgi:hypothetical protein